MTIERIDFINEKLYSVSQVAENTYYLWDKSSQIPTPHYYKTMNSVNKKIKAILKKVGA